ncbi:hypothetical protein KY284_016193 [Solanum tuberosum]|nr:hypothetical protein KY284_016193 [Solanum tuberosum]
MFKNFQALVERYKGKKLACINSDNGGDYIGPFDKYCREQGIRHHKTPPKTPQLTRLAQMMKITLVERAFVHVPKDERSKLDIKTRQCIFVGYGQDEFGYHFYDPLEKKLVRSRDVVFFEDHTIEDLEKDEKVDSESSESLVDVDQVPLTIALK